MNTSEHDLTKIRLEIKQLGRRAEESARTALPDAMNKLIAGGISRQDLVWGQNLPIHYKGLTICLYEFSLADKLPAIVGLPDQKGIEETNARFKEFVDAVSRQRGYSSMWHYMHKVGQTEMFEWATPETRDLSERQRILAKDSMIFGLQPAEKLVVYNKQ